MVTNNENYINKSITTHLEGLKLAESSPKYKLERPGYYSNISQFYLEHRNDFESAIYYGLKGHEISTKNNDFSNLSYISSWLGIAYYKKGDNKRGEHYLNEALIASQKPNVFSGRWRFIGNSQNIMPLMVTIKLH